MSNLYIISYYFLITWELNGSKFNYQATCNNNFPELKIFPENFFKYFPEHVILVRTTAIFHLRLLPSAVINGLPTVNLIQSPKLAISLLTMTGVLFTLAKTFANSILSCIWSPTLSLLSLSRPLYSLIHHCHETQLFTTSTFPFFSCFTGSFNESQKLSKINNNK